MRRGDERLKRTPVDSLHSATDPGPDYPAFSLSIRLIKKNSQRKRVTGSLYGPLHPYYIERFPEFFPHAGQAAGISKSVPRVEADTGIVL